MGNDEFNFLTIALTQGLYVFNVQMKYNYTLG